MTLLEFYISLTLYTTAAQKHTKVLHIMISDLKKKKERKGPYKKRENTIFIFKIPTSMTLLKKVIH
jgi:lipopolysaccharide export LptBFGC system permease protein LptF